MDGSRIWDMLDKKVLPLVRRPARYIGGEINSVYKELNKVSVRTALVFPDLYEVGMSNMGIRILYEEINAVDRFYAERAFSPWPDMESYMRMYNIPMFSLETHSPLCEFDIIAFSLQYELCYTNMLNIFNLSGLPLRSSERAGGQFPLVIAGGIMAYTPEPVSPFIDVFLIGDGEGAVVDAMEFYEKNFHNMPGGRKAFLEYMAKEIPYAYVPSLYKKAVPSGLRIKRNVLKNINNSKLPERPIVPLTGIVHERVPVEIMRGCPRSCRFCQAGVVYKPVRRRSIAGIIDGAYTSVKNTGIREIGLLSLSSTDFGGIEDVVSALSEKWQSRCVSVSLPSGRIDSFRLRLLESISKNKKTGITLAPEAASQKLLDIIKKGYKVQDIFTAAKGAYSLGYRLIKLYFMIGLPGETDDDLDELGTILYNLRRVGFRQINVSISTMIPKPHTPFQWMGMHTEEEIKRKQEYIKKTLKERRVKLKFHNPFLSLLEAVLGRGDRKLSDVIEEAWRMGARFDQWKECFNPALWKRAFSVCGVKMEAFLEKKECGAPLPWDHIDSGADGKYLAEEYRKALNLLNKQKS